MLLHLLYNKQVNFAYSVDIHLLFKDTVSLIYSIYIVQMLAVLCKKLMYYKTCYQKL